jgi:bifunctional oligoribonuclease and PAP phosphatase NrnA
MQNISFDEIGKRVTAANSIIVVSHDRPDGDALGSTLAMGRLLELQGKQVIRINADPVPEALSFLPDADKMERPAGELFADLVFVLDAGGRKRISEPVWEILPKSVPVVCIDHHLSHEPYGDFRWVDANSPATGQMIAELADACRWPMDLAIAENLYVAISTDTGHFRYAATTGKTLRIVADLLDRGVDTHRYNVLLNESFPPRCLDLVEEILPKVRRDLGGRCSSFRLTRETSTRLGLEGDDSSLLVSLLRSIKGASITIVFEELSDGRIRVSSRSKDEALSVAKVCEAFGGGGHFLAAGARLPGPIEVAEALFLEKVEELFGPIFAKSKPSGAEQM